MKPSTFALSFFGFCVFYICNADWMDHLYETLIEGYLGNDYEEVAPFVSSVTAGAEEFDKIIEELTKAKRRWYQTSMFLSIAIAAITFSVVYYHIMVLSKGRGLLHASRQLLSYFCQTLNSYRKTNEKVQNSVIEFCCEDNKTGQVTKKMTGDDEIPVKLLWKGGSLVESSIHCNVREDSAESKILHMQKQLLQSKLLVKCADMGGGDEMTKMQLSPTSSEESTALRMAEIRKLLESEPEIIRAFMDGDDRREGLTDGRGTVVLPSRTKASAGATSLRRLACRKAQKSTLSGGLIEEDVNNSKEIESVMKLATNHQTEDNKAVQVRDVLEANNKNSSNLDWDGVSDPKLMNRIRLLESRLRLEELKNKNWINRMSRAEGILQQLNKQVERIEEAHPMETRTETLKITSTITNWASASHPRRNNQFTLVNQYQPFYLDAPCLSLSEVIKKEIGFPSNREPNKSLYPLTPTPPIPALTSSNAMPQSSFFSKFLTK